MLLKLTFLQLVARALIKFLITLHDLRNYKEHPLTANCF